MPEAIRETELVETKPWWQSKMQWVNIGTAAVGVLTTVLEITGVIDLGPYKAEIVAMVTTAIAVVNIILRAISKSPLTLE